jgi:hypothetical protein
LSVFREQAVPRQWLFVSSSLPLLLLLLLLLLCCCCYRRCCWWWCYQEHVIIVVDGIACDDHDAASVLCRGAPVYFISVPRVTVRCDDVTLLCGENETVLSLRRRIRAGALSVVVGRGVIAVDDSSTIEECWSYSDDLDEVRLTSTHGAAAAMAATRSSSTPPPAGSPTAGPVTSARVTVPTPTLPPPPPRHDAAVAVTVRVAGRPDPVVVRVASDACVRDLRQQLASALGTSVASVHVTLLGDSDVPDDMSLAMTGLLHLSPVACDAVVDGDGRALTAVVLPDGTTLRNLNFGVDVSVATVLRALNDMAGWQRCDGDVELVVGGTASRPTQRVAELNLGLHPELPRVRFYSDCRLSASSNMWSILERQSRWP